MFGVLAYKPEQKATPTVLFVPSHNEAHMTGKISKGFGSDPAARPPGGGVSWGGEPKAPAESNPEDATKKKPRPKPTEQSGGWIHPELKD